MNKKKHFFLTLDLEEWYHLDYFKNDNYSKKGIMVKKLSPFFDMLDKHQIKITVFVLAELIKEYKDIILSISNKGHEIAIHGWNHELLYNKTNENFKKEIINAKNALEKLTNQQVIGYRAPCFSMDNEKLEILKDIGLLYDSSYILFNEHPLYGSLTIDDFEKVDDLIYKKNNFYEFELATQNLLNKNIPVSGGGYFRFFPSFVFNYIWKKYNKQHTNYVMYIHPFELTEAKVDLKNSSFANKLRFRLGRKNNLEKLEKLILKSKKQNFIFSTIKNYLNV